MFKKLLNSFVNWKYKKIITETKKCMETDESEWLRELKYIEFTEKVNYKTEAAKEIRKLIRDK